jgi:hypothetical protein
MAKKQLEVPGTERKTNKEIDDAAEGYVEARDKRMKLGEKEKAAKDSLIAVMKKHGVNVYKDESAGLIVMLQVKDGVKVSAAEDVEPEEVFDA